KPHVVELPCKCIQADLVIGQHLTDGCLDQARCSHCPAKAGLRHQECGREYIRSLLPLARSPEEVLVDHDVLSIIGSQMTDLMRQSVSLPSGGNRAADQGQPVASA